MIRLSDCRIKDDEFFRLIFEIFNKGQFVNGPYNKEFSKLWAEYNQKDFCVGTSSGSSALISSLKAVKQLSPKTKVIIPAFSFAATALAVKQAGLEIVYCGVDKNLLLDIDRTINIIKEENVLAVVPVHIYGQQLELGKLLDEEVFIIEDACQAHGVEIKGDVGCFSFYPSKNLGTCGNGGAIVTNHPEIYAFISAYINYGDPPGTKYQHLIEGDNLRLDEVQAAILVEKIKQDYLEKEIKSRRLQILTYKALGVEPFIKVKPKSTWHIFPILCNKPDKLVEIFKEKEIELGRHYPYALDEVVKGNVAYVIKDYSYLSKQQVSLPIGSHLEDEDVFNICELLKEVAKYENDTWVL